MARRQSLSGYYNPYSPCVSTRANAMSLAMVLLSVSCAFPSLGIGQTLTINQKTREAKLDSKTVTEGENLSVKTSKGVRIRVINTNSALYECAVKDTAASVPELDSLSAFLRLLGPYAPDLIRSLRPLGAVQPPTEVTRTVRWLDSVNIAMHGNTIGLERVRGRSLTMLDSIRTDFSDTGLGTAFQATRFCRDPECNQLKAVGVLLRALDSLDLAASDLRVFLRRSDEATRKKYGELVDPVEKVLDDQEKLIAGAYAVEKLAHATVTAKPTIDCKTLHVSWDKGRAFTVDLKPRSDAMLARLATDDPLTFKGTLQPKWRIHPALGLALLYADKAHFPKYGTSKLSGDSVKIVSNGTDDSRVMYGLTLGLSYRLAESGTNPGISLVPLEFVLNPIGDTKAVGIGAGIAYRLLRLSTGYIFVKHTTLDGQRLDQHLGSADELRTTETYHGGKMYFSLSIVGIPPFVREK